MTVKVLLCLGSFMSKYLCAVHVLIVDIWSVGCIMAELLTGQVLFKGNDRISFALKIHYFVCMDDCTCLSVSVCMHYVCRIPA